MPMTPPNTPITQLLGTCLPNNAPQKVKDLTLGDLWRLSGFRFKTDQNLTLSPNLNLTPQEKKVLVDAWICYIERQGQPRGDWSYDLNYMNVCCCCTTG